jgi:hypothetical protein
VEKKDGREWIRWRNEWGVEMREREEEVAGQGPFIEGEWGGSLFLDWLRWVARLVGEGSEEGIFDPSLCH